MHIKVLILSKTFPYQSSQLYNYHEVGPDETETVVWLGQSGVYSLGLKQIWNLTSVCATIYSAVKVTPRTRQPDFD